MKLLILLAMLACTVLYVEGKYTYSVVKSAKNWHDARAYCQSKGGDLANHGIRTAAERKTALAHLHLNGYYWIGFWDQHFKRRWTSIAGKAINTKAFGWDTHQPQGAKENVAVLYSSINKVHDYPMSSLMHFICEVKDRKPQHHDSADCAECEAHLAEIKAKYCPYTFFITAASGTEEHIAEECHKAGGELINGETMGFGHSGARYFSTIRALLAKENSLWIGLDDRQKEGEFHWSNGKKFNKNAKCAQVIKFGGGEPNDWSHSEDCVEWRRGANDMNDINCNKNYKGLCQVRKC